MPCHYLLGAQFMSARLKMAANQRKCYDVPILGGKLETHVKLIFECFIVETVVIGNNIN